MKSDTTVLVQEIYDYTNQVSAMMDSPTHGEDAVRELKEKLEALWQELDSVVRNKSFKI